MTEPRVRTIPYDRFRRTTARRMTESVTTKPQVTLHRSVDVTAVEAELEAAKSRHPDAPLGFTGAILAAVARGVMAGRVNGTVRDRTIELHDGVDLGVAVEVDGALVVPVIRDAHRRSVAEVSADLRRLSGVARSGGLRTDQVDGATFTVTGLGPMGVEFFSPIVNPPQLAILGVGAVRDGLALVDGEVAAVRRLGLSLSFDHAATDGADAARALDAICRTVERPSDLVWADDGSGRAARADRAQV